MGTTASKPANSSAVANGSNPTNPSAEASKLLQPLSPVQMTDDQMIEKYKNTLNQVEQQRFMSLSPEAKLTEAKEKMPKAGGRGRRKSKRKNKRKRKSIRR